MIENSVHYTVQDVSILFGCHEQTVRKLVNTGELPGLKVGHRIKISEKAITDYLDRQKIIPKGARP